MTFILILLVIVQSIALYHSIRKNFELFDIIDEAAQGYEETLKDLDYYYNRIDKKSKMELFLDEPVTRELVEDIKGTKKAIRNAAEKISVFIEDENEEKES